MFFTYLRHELRRRRRQAVVIALGLAVAIGLVITVTAASAGVSSAQASVLHALYGVGTDVTVTQAPGAGSGRPQGFRFGGGASGAKAGAKFSRDSLISAGMGTLSAATVNSVAGLRHVSTAAGGLTLTDTRVSGTVPSSASAGPGAGGGSSLNVSSFSVDGVDLAVGQAGPLSSAKVISGRAFRSSDTSADAALVSASYATQQGLKAGSAITVAGTRFTVVGIVSVPQGSRPADVFIPLARAQALSRLTGKVNTIYVAADSAASISAVSEEIAAVAPKATVTTASDLASEVSGSLSGAASLARNLGTWLAAAVLAAAILVAGLLTSSAVSRRVREFGTLKALGWRSRRVIGQVMGEALALGLIGGVAGVALGFTGARLVTALAPSLTAAPSVAPPAGGPGGAGAFGGAGGGGRGGGAFGRLAGSAGHTVSVHLTAPVTVSAVLLAVALAVAGGMIAGSFGGWRAARLRPAAALSRVG